MLACLLSVAAAGKLAGENSRTKKDVGIFSVIR